MTTKSSQLEKVELFKTEGNKCFQKSDFKHAIEAYTKALGELSPEFSETNLKATLLSNRAACFLKTGRLDACVQDCKEALDDLKVEDASIRCKLLYRRAKALFLLDEADPPSQSSSLQNAAKDLLSLLSIDASNKPAGTLLQTVRAKHNLTKGTPLSQTLESILSSKDEESRVHQCKLMLGLLTNDPGVSMELGRRGGVKPLMDISASNPKVLQVVSCACSHPYFVREFGTQVSQTQLTELIVSAQNTEVSFAALATWLRLVLYLDPLESISENSLVDGSFLVRSCIAAFRSDELVPAGLDLLGSWTTTDRESVIQASTDLPLLSHKKSEAEVRSMAPRVLAEYRKLDYKRSQRDKEWAKKRAIQFCQLGGLDALLEKAITCDQHSLRKQIGLGLGRMFTSIEKEEDVKQTTKAALGSGHVTIKEISEGKGNDEADREFQEESMKRVQLVSSMLLGNGDAGAWALGKIKSDVRDLIESGDDSAMAIASEVVSAAASVQKGRPMIISMLNSGSLEALLEHPDPDIRSGAASAATKLGLADKMLSTNEGEVIGLLEVAVGLLNQQPPQDAAELMAKASSLGEKSFATTAVERGIEVLGYLAAKTQVKEELAHGFRSPPEASQNAMDRLVELATQPKVGESVSSYTLASIFGLMAVSTQTLRREAFEGKEISMEQYDEMQALGKTEEEKELAQQEPDDTEAAVEERIQKMATANVPRAMVKLTEGASETALEKIITGMNRMAIAPSVRGLLIQQGVLSACIKVEKGDLPTDAGKNTLRQARQCAAKLLVSTNPGLLTTSQKMGSVKPLIQLIRDHEASDLQHFEALLAVTNLASDGDETKERIVSERGISTLNYAMFSDHELVRRAGTEALCNLVPHPAMMKHLQDPENLRLWLAFAADYDVNFECSRAAAGCLAMSTVDEAIAGALVDLKNFKELTSAMLESGNLELMHRILVVLMNLMEFGGKCKTRVVENGLVAFCQAYVESYHDGNKAVDMGFGEQEQSLMKTTVDLAIQIVQMERS